MIIFPQAKINLGLNVVERRADGYHNLQTVFYPVPLHDTLEVVPMHPDFPSPADCDLKITGIAVEGNEQSNLVVRAYNLLKKERPQLPRLHIHLHKSIPTQAGMGGGSSDCAAMMLLLNEQFRLGFSTEQLIERAALLGADCPFFILSKPAYAEGIGEQLRSINLNLSGWYLGIVCPPIPVSTKEAFSLITPHHPDRNCCDVVSLPIKQWRSLLTNDFEQSVFALHPEIGQVKEQLYTLGATYAAMSGSGSALFGIFQKPVDLRSHFSGMFTAMLNI